MRSLTLATTYLSPIISSSLHRYGIRYIQTYSRQRNRMASVPAADIRTQISHIIRNGDPSILTTKQIRQSAEQQLKLEPNSLIGRKNEINDIIEAELKSLQTVQSPPQQPQSQPQPTNTTTPSKRDTTSQSAASQDSGKKQKTEAATTQPNGDFMLDLGNRKRVTVGEYKGKLLINIREYYESNGEMKPGSKGIALNEEQFEKLHNAMDEIKRAVEAKR